MLFLYKKQKKTQKLKINRFLVSISFLGSAGPIRFVVKEDETVGNVIDYALKCYAREGRLPLLGSDSSFFLLYCPYSASEGGERLKNLTDQTHLRFTMFLPCNEWVLILLCIRFLMISAFNPWGEIGSTGSRNFVLSKKSEGSVETRTIRKSSGKWKAWLNKSLGLMLPSH